MTFTELQFGDVFYIDGLPYQCFKRTGRLVTALHLDPQTMLHVPDPSEDIGLRTSLFSDLRVNTNNATPAECVDYLTFIKTIFHEIL